MASFSKTCQIDIFFLPVQMKHLYTAEYEYTRPMKKPIALLPCAGKVKHSITVKTGRFGYVGKSKFRLCNDCFNFLYHVYKNDPFAIGEALAIEEDNIPIVRFRRNRL